MSGHSGLIAAALGLRRVYGAADALRSRRSAHAEALTPKRSRRRAAPRPRRRDAAAYADRVTLVHDASTGALVAYAFMNMETFQIPEEVKHWSGEERLTSNAASLAGHHILTAFKRKDPGTLPVAHLGALACSPFALKGLGARLITFQRAVALAYGHESALLALEAMKPLDETYYPRHKFWTTTPAFYKSCTSLASLTPMFSKLQAIDSMPPAVQAALVALAAPAEPLISAFQRDAARALLWPETAPETTAIYQAGGTLAGVCQFLWKTKDADLAGELLRQIVVRSQLEATEATKLWSMRHYSLAYGKPVPPEKTGAPAALASWCGVQPAVSVDSGERASIMAAWAAGGGS